MDHAQLWTVHGGPQDLYFKPEIDLFASRLNKQLPVFCSFGPDTEASFINAFTISWANKKLYVFLLPAAFYRCYVQNIIQDQATCMVVIHNWPTQAWYPLLTSLLFFLQSSFTPDEIYWNYQNGLSYSTVNTARSMLYSVLQLNINSSLPVGQLPIVKRLIQGIYELRLSLTRYTRQLGIWVLCWIMSAKVHLYQCFISAFKSILYELNLLSERRWQTVKFFSIKNMELWTSNLPL